MKCLFFFFFNDTATTEIYTFPYTTLFRSASAVRHGAGSLRWPILAGRGCRPCPAPARETNTASGPPQRRERQDMTDKRAATQPQPPQGAMWGRLFRPRARPPLSLQGPIPERLAHAILSGSPHPPEST